MERSVTETHNSESIASGTILNRVMVYIAWASVGMFIHHLSRDYTLESDYACLGKGYIFTEDIRPLKYHMITYHDLFEVNDLWGLDTHRSCNGAIT